MSAFFLIFLRFFFSKNPLKVLILFLLANFAKFLAGSTPRRFLNFISLNGLRATPSLLPMSIMYDFLGLDFLDFDALDQDLLNVDDIWVTALDETDHLLGELLYDMLDQLNAALMAIFKDELQRQNELLLKEEAINYE